MWRRAVWYKVKCSARILIIIIFDTRLLVAVTSQKLGVALPANQPLDNSHIEWIRMGTTVATGYAPGELSNITYVYVTTYVTVIYW